MVDALDITNYQDLLIPDTQVTFGTINDVGTIIWCHKTYRISADKILAMDNNKP